MAGKFTRLQKTYKIMDADGVAMYTGVVLSGENQCKKPIEDNEIPLGVVDNDERIDSRFSAGGDQTGKDVAVKLEGIAEIKLEGIAVVGDRIILGAGGVAKAIPLAEGCYNVLGFAEKSGEDGDVIPVRMAYHILSKGVTEPHKFIIAFNINEDGATVILKDDGGNTVSAEADETYKVEAGIYDYTITLQDYTTTTGSITVTNKDVVVDVTLVKDLTTANKYVLTFNISEDGATVVVKDSGGNTVSVESDGTYELEAGEYTYTVNLTGYEEATGTVSITNENVTENVTLVEDLG